VLLDAAQRRWLEIDDRKGWPRKGEPRSGSMAAFVELEDELGAFTSSDRHRGGRGRALDALSTSVSAPGSGAECGWVAVVIADGYKPSL
jgi:hypothetical protein